MQAPVLTFKSSHLRGEVAWLGEVLVGEIMPVPGARRLTYSWRVKMPDCNVQGPAPTSHQARSHIECEINEWLVRIGVFLPEEGVRVVVEEPQRVSHG